LKFIYSICQSSNDLSKNHAVVFVEDLSIRNMSKSESGSQENHGKNVKQKSGLNRETGRNSLPSEPSETGGSQEMAETPAVLFHESPGPPAPVDRPHRYTRPAPVDRSRRYTRILLILFLCTLPLVNPIVHGDGVGYYAYVRAPLRLNFTQDFPQAVRLSIKLTIRYWIQSGNLESARCRWFL
jgi:hypothetical protein